MKLSLSIEDREGVSCHLLSLDEDKVFLSKGETSIDMILGTLAQMHPFSTSRDVPLGLLRALAKDGLSCPRAVVLPGSLSMVEAPAAFCPFHIPEIAILMTRRSIAIPDIGEVALDAFCGTPPDRWGTTQTRSQRTPIRFRYRFTPDETAAHPTDVEAGSLISGMFSSFAPGPWGVLSEDYVGLAGLLLARRGDLFTDCVTTPLRSGHSSLREMRSNFHREGHVVSDRAWMPRQVLLGPRFAECRQASRDDLFDLGAELATHAPHHSAETIRQATVHILGALGEDPDEFNLRDEFAPAKSSHEALQVWALLSAMSRSIGLDPTTFEAL